jgi:hypothetical protein
MISELYGGRQIGTKKHWKYECLTTTPPDHSSPSFIDTFSLHRSNKKKERIPKWRMFQSKQIRIGLPSIANIKKPTGRYPILLPYTFPF